jgi:hypothetical protein
MSHHIFDNRHYVIIPYSKVGIIDFDQVIETSISTVRQSVDGTKTFVKYEGDMPSSVTAIEERSQEYSYEEVLAILKTAEWAY